MKPLHAMPLYFGDLLAATSDWEGEEVSLYLTLLGHQWALGSLPADVTKLCKLVRWSGKTFARFWPTVSAKFEERDGRLYNRRLEQHRERALERSATNSANGKRGAASKWGRDGDRNGEATANGMAKEWQTPSDSHGIPNQNQNDTQEKNEEQGWGKGHRSNQPSQTPDVEKPSDLKGYLPHSPPQDPRDFDTIKANVGAIAERFQTTDPARIYALGHSAYKLSKKQCEVACKQLREDGFFDRLKIGEAAS